MFKNHYYLHKKQSYCYFVHVFGHTTKSNITSTLVISLICIQGTNCLFCSLHIIMFIGLIPQNYFKLTIFY